VRAAGIDGCRFGWVAAVAVDGGRDGVTTELRRFPDIDDVVRWWERATQGAAPRPPVAIDMPIGLPGIHGPRACDREARRVLGRRWMCVFAPPDRELLGHDFTHAREIVLRRRAADPSGSYAVATHQTVNIAPKIAAVDRALRAAPDRREWLIEAHPEVSFRALAGADLASKRSAAGAARRRALVAGQFPDAPARLVAVRWQRAEVGADDLLDAYAALWTALRFLAGVHTELGDGTRDEFGLRQRIIV
jgi:predicted RNase H-like nuclease